MGPPEKCDAAYWLNQDIHTLRMTSGCKSHLKIIMYQVHADSLLTKKDPIILHVRQIC